MASKQAQSTHLARDAFFAGALALSAYILLRPFADPDDYWGARHFLAAGLATSLVILSVWGVGFWLARYLLPVKDRLLFAAPLGTAGLALFLSLLGVLSAWGSSFHSLYLLLLAWGIFHGLQGVRDFRRSGARTSPVPLWLPLALLPLAWIPQAHSDPLYYHLLAPRWWQDAGWIFFPTDHPLAFLAGVWEALYAWPTLWLGVGPGQELVYQQIAGQVLTLIVGFGGSISLAVAIARGAGVARPEAVALVAVASGWLLPISYVAKNDWGVVLWWLAGAALFQRANRRQELFLAGAFWGLAASAKWFGLVSFPILIVPLLFAHRRKLTPVALGFCGGALFLIGRNWLATGAPFFPLFTQLHLSEADIQLFSDFQPGAPSWRAWALNVGRFFSWPQLLLLALPWAWSKMSRVERKFSVLVGGGLLLSTAIVGLLLSASLSWRLAPLLPLAWGAYAGWAVVKAAPARWPLDWLALALAVAVVSPGYHSLPRLFRQPGSVIREFQGGDAMAFLRLHGSGAPAAVGGNPQLFYISHLPAVTPEAAPARNGIHHAANAADLLAALGGLRWFVETRNELPLGVSSFLVDHLVAQVPQAVVYLGRNGRVVDLDLLRAECAKPGRCSEPFPRGGAILVPQK